MNQNRMIVMVLLGNMLGRKDDLGRVLNLMPSDMFDDLADELTEELTIALEALSFQ